MATSGQLVGAFVRDHPEYRGGLRGESGAAIEAQREAGLEMISGFSWERSACQKFHVQRDMIVFAAKEPTGWRPGPLALGVGQVRRAYPESQPDVWRRKEAGREPIDEFRVVRDGVRKGDRRD